MLNFIDIIFFVNFKSDSMVSGIIRFILIVLLKIRMKLEFPVRIPTLNRKIC